MAKRQQVSKVWRVVFLSGIVTSTMDILADDLEGAIKIFRDGNSEKLISCIVSNDKIVVSQKKLD